MRKLALPFLLIPLVAIGAYGCGDGGDDGCPKLDPGCTPTLTVDACRRGDWEAEGFKNQGQCERYVETGKDSRNGG